MSERTTLTPEQSRALSVFETCWNNFDDLLSTATSLSLESICVTDTKIFTHLSIKTKTLPRGVDWLWNQSRSRQFVTLGNGRSVCFYKLNTRKARKVPGESPPYKLWVYNITQPSCQEVSFLWCERGLEEPAETNPKSEEDSGSEIEVCTVTLEELAFLRQFTTPMCATLFGWDEGQEQENPEQE